MENTDVSEISYLCSADHSMQPAMVWFAQGNEARPLVVALHTWSFDHTKFYQGYLEQAQQYNWHFIFPEFRGPNWNPQGLGSELALSDVRDAVKFMQSRTNVDADRIYLIGASGGGHGALLYGSRLNDVFAAVSAGCPISDVGRWHAEKKMHYWEHIEKAVGGDPDTDPVCAAEAKKRSPVTYLAAARALPFEIQTGIHDGHGHFSVPVGHAVRAFNELADPADRISEAEIAILEKEERIPESMAGTFAAAPHEGYGNRVVHFRRISGNVRLTLFEGGHEMSQPLGFAFLNAQRKGKAANWDYSEKVSGPGPHRVAK